MEDLFSTFSADPLTDTNYCNVLVKPAYNQQHKWWTACKHCFMTSNTISFVSQLIWKRFRWKFIYIHIKRHIWRCLLITYGLFCWFIAYRHAKVRDVFSGHPVKSRKRPSVRPATLEKIGVVWKWRTWHWRTKCPDMKMTDMKLTDMKSEDKIYIVWK